MRIDAKQRICGVRPADLKMLLRAGDRFDTPTAMRHWQAEEPEITSTLIAMQQEGWIEFSGREEAVDWWNCAQLGRRLAATTLLKRIAREQGQAILARLIEEARAINADGQNSRRVTRILLFGSLLTGTAEKTVGDIDVVIDHRRRSISEEKWRALEEHERADAPESVRANFSDLLSWPETRLTRRLAKVSPYLSIHREHDLPGNLYVEVYAYDLAQEREILTDPTPRTHEGNREPEYEPIIENARHSRPDRDWPTASARTMVSRLNDEQMRLSQHLWMNGKSVKAIAATVQAIPNSIQAYLASRAHPPLIINRTATPASLKVTVLAILPAERDYLVQIRLRQHRTQLTIETTLLRARQGLACLRRTGRNVHISQAPVEAVRTLQGIDQAAWLWYEAMRPKWRGLNLEVDVDCAAHDTAPVNKGARRIDPRRLKQPLMALLACCWKEPRKRYTGYDQHLAVSLEAEPIVSYLREQKGEHKRILGPTADEVIETARSIYRDCDSALEGTSVSVYVTGEILESPECFTEGPSESAEE